MSRDRLAKLRVAPLAIVGLVSIALASAAQAGIFCVNTSAGLQSALAIAGGNLQDDRIRVVQGVYPISGNSPFDYPTNDNFDLRLEGGYAPGCASRVLDARNTILDGLHQTRVLNLSGSEGTSGDILLQGFTLRNGNITDDSGGGALISGFQGYAGNVTVDHNIFRDNASTNGGGGLEASADLGLLTVTNNVFLNNSADYNGAGEVGSNGLGVIVTNNTAVGNTSSGGTGRFRVFGSGPQTLSNNVFWGNQGQDLSFNFGALLDHNDYHVATGTPSSGSTGNIDVDPLFVSATDPHLTAGSPAISAGTNAPPGGLPAVDVEGSPRLVGPLVDLGAYEAPTVAPPPGPYLSTPSIPGFQFKVRIGGAGGTLGAAVGDCIAETLCVSGAIPGRAEVFARVVGPKPNGRLWPTLVKFTTSPVEIWIRQTATSAIHYYGLEGAAPNHDVLTGLFDRQGFVPTSQPADEQHLDDGANGLDALLADAIAWTPTIPAPPAGPFLTTVEIPGFAFKVRIGGAGGALGAKVANCIGETLCVSGAVAGRAEAFVRVVGPKPNGHLWPTLVKFTTSEVEVWVQQTKNGTLRYYQLPAASPDSGLLPGLFDRLGFLP